MHTYNQGGIMSAGPSCTVLKVVRKRSHSFMSSSFAPLVHQRWADLHTEPRTPARVVRLGSGMKASTSWGEKVCWSSALKQLLPSPPTPASAKIPGLLLGSTGTMFWKVRLRSSNASAVFNDGDFPLISVGMITRFGATAAGTWKKRIYKCPTFMHCVAQ